MADLIQENPGPARLRELLAGDRLVVAPGAYDALSARLVERDLEAPQPRGALAFDRFNQLIGMPDVSRLESRFAVQGTVSEGRL
jgi:hypothetical protein